MEIPSIKPILHPLINDWIESFIGFERLFSEAGYPINPPIVFIDYLPGSGATALNKIFGNEADDNYKSIVPLCCNPCVRVRWKILSQVHGPGSSTYQAIQQHYAGMVKVADGSGAWCEDIGSFGLIKIQNGK